MCYGMGCQYESYPYGYNEGCVCKKPKWVKCPAEYKENEEPEDEPEDELNYYDWLYHARKDDPEYYK